MNPAEAKRVVQSTQWTFHKGDGKICGPHLQALWTKPLSEAVQALGIDFNRPADDSKGYSLYGTTGGSEFSFHGQYVNIIAEAGANFPERNQFLIGKSLA